MYANAFLGKTVTTTLLCCTLMTTACVNRIDEEIQEGDVPITFKARVDNITTKVSDTGFSKGDKVGLYAVLSATSFESKPYIDNLCLTCGTNSTLIPEKSVFYPEGNATLDFVSYYPYQSKAKPEGETVIAVSAATDQNDSLKHALSDFIIARKSKVASSSKAVELEYQHKFAKIRFSLTPSGDESIQNMLKADPRLVATGLKTKANYNIENDTFSDFEGTSDIVAYGDWSIEEGTLVGKEIYIIPQNINADEQAFTLDWNGKVYSCAFPSLDLEKSTQYEIAISTEQTSSNVLQGIVAKISEWKDGAGGITNNQKEYATIHLSALSFAKSDIYRVYYNSKPMVEICKEYLKSDKLTSTAIVAYPVLDNEKTDLTQGVVLQLLDKKEAINGGKINWITSSNSFTYQEGSSPFITKFYTNEKKEILLTPSEDIVNVNIASYTIRDVRNGKLEEYPIVKIGTQYWMKTELRATTDQTGKKLENLKSLGTGAGYFKPDSYEYYFYNGEAILASQIPPTGWKIPSDKDWESFKTYVKNDASLLKTGKWQTLSSGEVAPINNLSQFSASPVGLWYNGTHYAYLKMVGYWSLNIETNEQKDPIPTIPSQTVFLTGEGSAFVMSPTKASNKDYYKALSIRCVKE